MASAKQLTGGTNDVNPQWWNLGMLVEIPAPEGVEHSTFNYWFYDGPVCGTTYWQNGGFDPSLPAILPSGYATCAAAAGAFPLIPYNYKWRATTKEFNIPLLPINR
jgi:hypothetical protein